MEINEHFFPLSNFRSDLEAILELVGVKWSMLNNIADFLRS